MHKMWTGTLGFGMVSIPVGVAVSAKRTDPSFRTLHRDCLQPIRQPNYCETHGEITADDCVKGYEVSKGEYIPVEPGDLEALKPERSRSIDIVKFVNADDVDDVLCDTTYYLVPDAAAHARRGYVILRDALAETGRVGVCRFVFRDKEHVALVRPYGDALTMTTLYYAEDLRSASAISDVTVAVMVTQPEREMAALLVESMAGEFAHDEYKSEHRERVAQMLQALSEGVKPVKIESEAAAAPTVDFAAALKASVEDAQRRRTETAKRPTVKRPTVKRAEQKRAATGRAPAKRAAKKQK